MNPNTETKMSEAQEPVAWKLVPVEPNKEMLLASQNSKSPWNIIDAYKAMIEAAPILSQDQNATIAAQQAVIKQMRLFITDNCLNTAGKEVNGNKLSRSARETLTIQPSLDTLKAHDAEVQAELIKEIKRLDTALVKVTNLHSSTLNYAVARVIAQEALNERPPHIAKLIGGE